MIIVVIIINVSYHKVWVFFFFSYTTINNGNAFCEDHRGVLTVYSLEMSLAHGY